jgi:hypothetical protein
MTGQHAPEGFLVVRGAGIAAPREIRAEELGDLIAAAIPAGTHTSL